MKKLDAIKQLELAQAEILSLKTRLEVVEEELRRETEYRQVDKPKGVKRCDIPGCQNKMEAKGLCKKHYNMTRRSRSLDKCVIDGCDKYVESRGLCAMHYQQERRGIIKSNRDAENAKRYGKDGKQKIYEE